MSFIAQTCNWTESNNLTRLSQQPVESQTILTADTGGLMRTIKQVAQRIALDPFSPENKVLSNLIVSLERGQSFGLNDLYTLSENDFDIAMVILSDWRLDRYCFGHASKIA